MILQNIAGISAYIYKIQKLNFKGWWWGGNLKIMDFLKIIFTLYLLFKLLFDIAHRSEDITPKNCIVSPTEGRVALRMNCSTFTPSFIIF